MRPLEHTPYYNACLKQGLIYQDFIYELLHKHGISTVSYGSQLFQQIRGENKAGMEIKFDDKRQKTGNLYIEVAERSQPIFNYSPGGIYRECTEFIIGDYEVVYRLAVTHLRRMHQSDKFPEFEISLQTSRGFLLSETIAEKWAIKVYYPNCTEEVKRLMEANRENRLAQKESMRELFATMNCDPKQGKLFD
jgi:hypothetical protein